MARERSPERDKAKQMWLESGGTMKLKDIAAALSVGETQVRKWKSQDKWADDLNSNVTNESKSNVTKRGAPKGNKNAVGNRGGAPQETKTLKGIVVGRVVLFVIKRLSRRECMKLSFWMPWRKTSKSCLIRLILLLWHSSTNSLLCCLSKSDGTCAGSSSLKLA